MYIISQANGVEMYLTEYKYDITLDVLRFSSEYLSSPTGQAETATFL